MENLHHLKELEYLNLALNNIDMIQGNHLKLASSLALRSIFPGLENIWLGDLTNRHSAMTRSMTILKVLNFAPSARVSCYFFNLGLDRCEFLNKLDMTVNFVDFDALEQSVTNLQKCRHLGDLFMMGNPCQVFPLELGVGTESNRCECLGFF